MQEISNYKANKHFHTFCDIIIEGKKMNEIVLSPCEKATIQYYYDNLTDEQTLFDYLENGPLNRRASDKYGCYCGSVYVKLQKAIDFFTANPGSLNYKAMQTLALPLNSCKNCYRCDLYYSTGLFSIYCHVSDEEYDNIVSALMNGAEDELSDLRELNILAPKTVKAIRSKVAHFLIQKGGYTSDYFLRFNELEDDATNITNGIDPIDAEFDEFNQQLDRMLTDEELEEYLSTLPTPSYKDMTDDELESHLQELHAKSFANGAQIYDSHICGCFSCGEIFRADEVTGWISERGMKITAMCPYCGIDAVLGDACGERITPEMLKLMGERFFGVGVDYE